MGAYTLCPAGGHPTVWRVLPGKPGFHFRFFSGRWLFPLPATPPDSVRTRHIHGVTTYGTYPWGGQTACSRNQGKRRANATVQNRWNRCNLRIVKKSLVICSFPDQPVQKKQFSWFRDRVVDMVMIFFGCLLSTFLKHACSCSQSVFLYSNTFWWCYKSMTWSMRLTGKTENQWRAPCMETWIFENVIKKCSWWTVSSSNSIKLLRWREFHCLVAPHQSITLFVNESL